MKRIHLLLIGLAALSLSSCAPSISGKISRGYPELKSDAEVVVVGKDAKLPKNALKIGSLSLGPAKLTSKKYGELDNLLTEARALARMHGGNIVKVTDYLPAEGDEDIGRLWFDVFYKYDLSDITPLKGTPAVSKYTDLRDKYSLKTKDQLPPSFRVAANFGAGIRPAQTLGETETSVEEHNHDMKMNRGLVYSADAEFYLTNNIGVGLKYNILHSAQYDMIPLIVNYVKHSVYYDETTNISFLGPVFSLRLLSNDHKHWFITNIGAGRVSYWNKVIATTTDNTIEMPDVNYITKGGNLGGTLDVNYDYHITEKLAIGANLSYVLGFITRARVYNYDGTLYEQDDGSRVDLSTITGGIGLRFNF